MNQQALNEAISTWFGIAPCRCEKNANGYSVHQYDGETGNCLGCGGSATIDFFASEAANARLLEAMPEPEVYLESSKTDKIKIWGCCPDMEDMHAVFYDNDRKTAVVMAFCKFAGIEVEK